MGDQEIVVQITAPLEVMETLRAAPIAGVDIEPPVGGREQTTRFGLAEVALALAVCAGVEKVVKLGIEIRNMLREKHQPGTETGTARMTTPDHRLQLDISEDDTLEDLEHAVEEVLKAQSEDL